MAAHSIHIAVLDDDPSVRVALVRLLNAAGMVAHAHATSEELFESIALKCPDCLLLDLHMPGMSGVDVLTRLDQLGVRIPTIILTARDDVGPREACLNAGAAEYLLKPVDADELIQAIKRISG